MYVMVRIRLNLTQVVGYVSKYVSRLRRKHWQSLKRILRYLKGN